MKSIIAAVILAGAAGAAFAHAGDFVVPQGESCPPGTTQTVPSYTYEGGRFVRNGTVCQDRRYRN